MDEKPNPAADNPAPATDQAPEESSNQDPTAAADQGVGAAEANDPNTESSETVETAAADAVETAAGEPEEAPLPEVATEVVAEVAEQAEEAAVDVEEVTQPPEVVEAAAPEATEDAAEAAPVEASAEADAGELAAAQMAVEAALLEAAAQLAEEAAPEGEAAEAPAPAAAESSDSMTMEEVLAASDEQLERKPVHRGLITTGEIIMLSQEGIVVDVGAKIEGTLPYNQLFEFGATAEDAAKYFKPGDKLQVYVVRSDIPNNTIVLSKKRADQERAWNLLQEITEKQKPVEVEIVEKVKGGLVANLGVRAFLPASQVNIRRVTDLTPYVGLRLKVKIIELNRKRNRVIISRRSILEEEIAEKKTETLQKLEPGLKTDGEVVEITDFGVFVNLGGIDGLVHRSELSHGRFNHPRDVVKLGEAVEVEVLDMDLERERVNLSMKTLISNPWEDVLGNYQIGNRVNGKVTNLTQFGAFVEIEPGLEGLIHVSEMSWTKRVRHPKEILTEGEDVEALILKIDTAQRRISLGLRQTQPDPWSSLPDRYPPGTELTGPITGITDFGVFMELEEGIEGLVHISELAHEHIDDINEHFNRGDEITAVILNIDPVEQRASLSRKRLLPFSASQYGEEGVPSGAPAARGGRKGRRGRRGADIDYDYGYAAADAASKTTTKLGDVYADLFAQFGLTEGQANTPDDAEAATDAAAPEAASVEAEVAAEAAPVEAEAEAAPDEAATEPEAEVPAVEAVTEEAVAPTEPEEEPEDVIDAAEAAALLTAAFRDGRRPAAEEVETEAAAEPDAEVEAIVEEVAAEAEPEAEPEAAADGDAEVAAEAETESVAATDEAIEATTESATEPEASAAGDVAEEAAVDAAPEAAADGDPDDEAEPSKA